MNVTKRNGSLETVSFDKITKRLGNLSKGLSGVSPIIVAQKTIASIFDGITTREIDILTADIAISLATDHPDYGVLASNILISNLHKETSSSILSVFKIMNNNLNVYGEKNSLVADDVWQVVKKHSKHLDSLLNFQKDYTYDYFAIKTLEKMYLTKVNGKVVERPQHMLLRVALGIWKNDMPKVEETYKLLSDKLFTHASPTLFNAGMKHPNLSSCFLLDMEDSIDGIYKVLADCAKISKHGGGIGVNCHSIRSRDAIIRGTNGSSTGIIPMLRTFNATARYVNQGSRRNGSIAFYIEPHHPDLLDFLSAKRNHGNEEERARDLFYALWVSDLFMKRVENDEMWSFMDPDRCKGLCDVYGDEYEALYTKYESEGRYVKQMKAQAIWTELLVSQIELGNPYVVFKDSVNRKSNQKNVGVIKSSNLCVAPETMVLTDKGYFPIIDLHGKEVNVWNGQEFSTTIVRKTGENQKLLHVSFGNGMTLRCTPYHKFYIETGSRPANKSKPVIVEAKDLKLGMKLIRCDDFPTINLEKKEFKYPYTHGLFSAEGTYNRSDDTLKHRCNYQVYQNTDFCKKHQKHIKKYDTDGICCADSNCDKPLLYLYGEKKKLLQYIDWSYYNVNDSSNRIDISLPYDIPKKFLVPMNHDITTKLQWLAGLVDGDGCIVEFNGVKNIQLASIELEFIQNVLLMLQTLGVYSSIGVLREARNTNLPDGKGSMKFYPCKKCYRINIDCKNLLHLIDLGFSPKRLDIADIRPPHHQTNKYIQITGVEDNGDVDDTYCFNEPKRHMGIFNGILTGQCSEITEFTSPTETAVCNLSSISLPAFVQGGQFDFHALYKVTKVCARNLDRVIDVTFYPIEEARRSNLRHRPIGIGVQGLADVFIMLKHPFESDEAMRLNREIFETIYFAALETSMELAKENGAYETFKGSPTSEGILQCDLWDSQPTLDLWDWKTLRNDIVTYGLRNSLSTAVMPTASTSQLLGNNECIEPYTSNMYLRRTLAGEFVVINKHLVRDLIRLGIWDKEIRDDIIRDNGSVQSVSRIPDDIKELYKTAWEIKQKTLVDMAISRGAFVCQSQSLNIFMGEPSFKKLSSMLFYGWKGGIKTGIYYLRSRGSGNATKVVVDSKQPAPVVEEEPECVMCSG